MREAVEPVEAAEAADSVREAADSVREAADSVRKAEDLDEEEGGSGVMGETVRSRLSYTQHRSFRCKGVSRRFHA